MNELLLDANVLVRFLVQDKFSDIRRFEPKA
jgi:hypothetical protein